MATVVFDRFVHLVGDGSKEHCVLSVSVCDEFFGGWYGGCHHTIEWRTANAYQQDTALSGSVGRFSAAAEQAEVHGIRRTWCRRASSDSEVLWNDRQDTKAEGPTDVMALVTLGLASGESVVCNVHGSGEKPERTPWLSEYFKDRDVVVIGDNDTSSQRGARHWAQFIAGTAKGCRLAKLPGPVTQTGR
ncbi:MAG: hypothetical protein R6U98_14230 [Pirellulaceae bacterium]